MVYISTMEQIASGNTLEEIKKIQKSKNKENTKVMQIFLQVHRTDFSERSQKTMDNFFIKILLSNFLILKQSRTPLSLLGNYLNIMK